ncbi:MAG: hypothetical protein KDD63_13060, partial [Bacteroidetes bacterium]|nr:hypothetical protein [Bacteroidota bacterium]
MAKNKKTSTNSSLKEWQKQALTHVGIIAGFVLIAILLFRPIFFENMVFDWKDIRAYEGVAKETKDFRAETGEEALWVSTVFSGMPAFQSSIDHFGNFFTSINKIFWLGLPRPANYIFLYFIGFYFLLITLRVNPWLSAIGALAFGFSSYFFVILPAGHASKANAIAYMAPVLAGVLMAYRGKYILGASITAFFLALELTANHVQVTYYLALTIGLIIIAYGVDAIMKKQLPDFVKASLFLLIAAIIGTGPNIGRLWTTYEYAAETMRGKAVLKSADTGETKPGLEKDYAFNWSYGISESLTLLIPNFYGSASVTTVDDRELARRFQQKELVLPTYWGPQPSTSGPVYAGAIICFLFVLGLFLIEGKTKWWLIAATVFFLVLSWGKNFAAFNYFMFDYFPLYNKFRAPTIACIIVELTFPLLGIMALSKIFDSGEKLNAKDTSKWILVSAAITGGLALFLALLGPSIMSFQRDADIQRYQNILEVLREVRISMFRTDAFRAFGFIAVSAGLLWAYINGRVKKPVVYAGLAVLILLDMAPVATRYVNESNFAKERAFKNEIAPTTADQAILKDTDPNFRVFNFTSPDGPFNDAQTSYFHKSVGGYHPAKLRRYQHMIEQHISRETQELGALLQSQPGDSSLRAGLASLKIFNMLNTRYFIYNPQAPPLPNYAALGNAWFVNKIQYVNSP